MKAGVIVSFISVIIGVVHCSDEVPVVVWGSGSKLFNYHIPALRKLTTSEFHEDFVRKLAFYKPNAVGVFVEEALSIEDFVSQGSDEQSAYPLLQKQIESESSSKFLPYVTNPVKALKSLSDADYAISESFVNSGSNGSKTVFLFKLDDVKDNENRLKLLKRHDEVIHEMCSQIHQKYDTAVCVLTAKRPSWIEPEKVQFSSRHILQNNEAIPIPSTTATPSGSPIYYYSAGLGLIYTQSYPVLTSNADQKKYILSDTLEPTKNGDSMSVKFKNTVNAANPITVIFNFKTSSEVWNISSIDVSTSGKLTPLNESSVIVTASLGNSFHTPANVTFSTKGTDPAENFTLTFNTLQAQYKPSSLRFGPAEDTVYFFTVPILSGLFVSSLLMAIILFGLSMIFDIKTMDQFDDPKGKSITINASD